MSSLSLIPGIGIISVSLNGTKFKSKSDCLFDDLINEVRDVRVLVNKDECLDVK